MFTLKLFKKTIFLLSLCLSQVVYGQAYNWWVNAQVLDGVILAHSKKVAHLIKGRPSGFEINFQKELNGSKAWERLYNLPIVNYGFSYYDLANEAQLGELFITSASVDLPLSKRKFTNLYFRIGTGLVYSTNPYDRDTNNQNTMIGSKFTCLIQTRLCYEIKIHENIKLTPTLNITHASNGAQSVPNMGINMVTTNMGVSYKFIEQNIHREITDPAKIDNSDYSYKYYLLFSSGKNTVTAQVRKPQIFFNLGAFIQKYLSKKSDLQFGIEYFHNIALKKQIETSWFNRNLSTLPDFKRAGIVVGHELKAGSLGFITQLGLYIYNPSKSDMGIYQRYGIKNEFSSRIIGQISLKVHAATAEQIEFGLGWKL